MQDEGSQLATLLSGARPRQQVMDLCAGAGGKTLALAALMENSGQLYAYDSDRMPAYDIDKLPEQLANPLKHRFVSRLFVAENARDQTLGVALLLHAPDIGFSYLELISTALGRTGRGIGAALYERVREEARALGTQLYFESLPDDPALSPNLAIRAENANRLKFYERYGARPIANTAYETPVKPTSIDPPYLLLDPLGSNDLPSRDKVKKVIRAILERKYVLAPEYVQLVVDSITDDPVCLREPRYTKSRRALKAEIGETAEPRIALVLNDDHTIHHDRRLLRLRPRFPGGRGAAHHQRGARHQPRGLRHHFEAAWDH